MKMLLKCGALLATGLTLGEIMVKAENAVAPSSCTAGVSVPVAPQWSPRKYLKAHPVPVCPGMAAGVPVKETQVGLSADSPWTETLVISPTGERITVTCGSVPGQRRTCGQPLPDLGAYQYVPVNGDASSAGSIIVIPVIPSGSIT